MLHLYHASAGAGKTHVLVLTYLQLALQEPLKFQEVLAVTFTNKATQEVKERILHHLYELAQNQKTLLSAELSHRLHCSQQTLHSRAKTLLNNLLHHYQYFSVSTLDGFSHQIVRTFIQETGLKHGTNVEMDEEHVLHTLVCELVYQLPQHPDLQACLASLAAHKLRHGQPFDIHKELLDLGHALLYILPSSHQQDAIRINYTVLRRFLSKLQRIASHFEHTLRKLGTQALSAISKAGLTSQDFAHGKQGITGFFEKLRQKRSFIPTQRVYQALKSTEAWHTVKTPHAQTIRDLVSKHLAATLARIIAFYHKNHTNYATTRAIQRLLPTLNVALHLQHLLSHYRYQNAVLLVSDATRFLQKIALQAPTSFMYESAGIRYKHFLVDELQDLTTSQWNNLKLLIQNGLSEGHESLAVGDAKQAIYRWRGGHSQPLHTQVLEDLGKHNVQQIHLRHNWRSNPNLVAFHNAFFPRAAKVLIQHLTQEIEAEVIDKALQETLLAQLRQITAAYTNSQQSLPEDRLYTTQGYVNITFLNQESPSVAEKQQEAIKRTISCVEMLQKKGFKAQNTAILVRDNQEARVIAQALLDYKKTPQAKTNVCYDTAVATASTLGTCPWISCLIAALHYLTGDCTASTLATLIHTYQTYGSTATGQRRSTEEPSIYFSAANEPEQALRYLPKLLRKQEELKALPLYALVQKLVVILGLQRAESALYLQAFQDLVIDFISEKPGHLTHFLVWWQERGHRSVVHSLQQEAIQVTTIHQSKGLEFDAIIVPFCTWRLDHSSYKPPVIWCSTEKPPFSNLDSAPLYYGKHLNQTVYKHAYYQEKCQAHVDQLNLLYVALTRAKCYLHVFAPVVTDRQMHTVADLMLHVLENLRTLPKDASFGLEENSHVKAKVFQMGTLKSPIQPARTNTTTEKALDLRGIAHEAHHERLLSTVTDTSRDKSAIWIHQVLAQIYQTSDLPKVLHKEVKMGKVSPEVAENFAKQVAIWWRNDLLKNFFSGSWHVRNESTVMLPSGALIRPDRVMTKGHKMVILDFKTGQIQPKHVQQLNSYAHQLSSMEYKHVQAYLFYTEHSKLILCSD